MAMKERIRLSEHFTYRKLFRFVLPSVVMMVFVSVYGIVDGFFVSYYAGEMPFVALNLIFPFIMILGSVGFMLGTGGNAAVSKALGEGDPARAKHIFSMLIYTTVAIGVVLSALGIAFARPVARMFAATENTLSAVEKEQLIEYCVVYARIILLALPMYMIQNAFQGFFVTAEKAGLGLFVTIAAGLGNMLFDWLFVGVFGGGLVGAAFATALSQTLGGVLPLFYFFRKNDSLLRLGKTKFEGRVFINVCVNGMSEMFTNIALSVVAIFFNAQLMSYVGYSGVEAYGIMNYIGFIFIAAFIGYAVGSAPIVGYHYGAENRKELKNIFSKSLIIVSVAGCVMTLIACIFARPLSLIFVHNNPELLALTVRGMRIFALCFLGTGINIFASSFFTALSNGALSLLISFVRTFLFQIIFVLLLPLIWQVDGIWAATAVSETVTLALTAALWISQRKRYGYL